MAIMTPEEIVDKFNDRDFATFRERILKYISETPDNYRSFEESELFFKTKLQGYINRRIGQDFLQGKETGRVYELVMKRVMKYLTDRGDIERLGSYPYGKSETVIYLKKEH